MRSQARGRAALLIPGQRSARLVFGDPRLEEVLFLPQIGLLVQPGQVVFSAGEGFLDTRLAGAAVGDEAELLSAFGSQVVFGIGLLIACGMALGALGVIREANKLPAAGTQGSGASH